MLTLKSGVGWDGCDIPTDKYTYSIASQIEVTDEKGVDESSDGRVAALLAWIPQKKSMVTTTRSLALRKLFIL